MLQYLFTAEFADGSTLRQSPEDRSAIDPEKRSQFYDLLEKDKTTPVVKFTLRNIDPACKDVYAVDLRDGHFEVDGISFRMHEDEVVGFELIFFRQHTHSFNVSTKNTSTEGQNVTQKEVGHEIVYRMGWKLKGDQQYQRVMQIK